MKLTNNLKIVKNNFNKSLPSHLKDLNARSKEIFSLIVDDFLKTGNPRVCSNADGFLSMVSQYNTKTKKSKSFNQKGDLLFNVLGVVTAVAAIAVVATGVVNAVAVGA